MSCANIYSGIPTLLPNEVIVPPSPPPAGTKHSHEFNLATASNVNIQVLQNAFASKAFPLTEVPGASTHALVRHHQNTPNQARYSWL